MILEVFSNLNDSVILPLFQNMYWIGTVGVYSVLNDEHR